MGSHGSRHRHHAASQNSRRVFVALGSNIGDSVKHIETACRLIDDDHDMRIVDTSCLYRTKAMYVENQDDFVNGACEVVLSPVQYTPRCANMP